MKHNGWVPWRCPVALDEVDQRGARHEQTLGSRVDEVGEPGERVGGAECAVGAVGGEHRDQSFDVALGDRDRVLREQLLDLDEILSSWSTGCQSCR